MEHPILLRRSYHIEGCWKFPVCEDGFLTFLSMRTKVTISFLNFLAYSCWFPYIFLFKQQKVNRLGNVCIFLYHRYQVWSQYFLWKNVETEEVAEEVCIFTYIRTFKIELIRIHRKFNKTWYRSNQTHKRKAYDN